MWRFSIFLTNSGVVMTLKMRAYFWSTFLIVAVVHALPGSSVHLQRESILAENANINNVPTFIDDNPKLGGMILTQLHEILAAVDQGNVFDNINSPSCVSHLSFILNQLDEWIRIGIVPDAFTLQLVDAWGKLSSGVLSGHLTDFGDFDECIDAKGFLNATLPAEVHGSYSVGIIVFTPQTVGLNKLVAEPPRKSMENMRTPESLLDFMSSDSGSLMDFLPQIGTCFPNSCSPADVQQFVNNVMNVSFGTGVRMGLYPRIEGSKPPLDLKAQVMIGAIVLILNVCLIGTLLDVAIMISKSNNESKGVTSILRKFSLYSNTRKLFKGLSKNEADFTCFHGIQFLSFAWILLQQSWVNLNLQATSNACDLRESIRSSWLMMLVLNSNIAADSLFVINGAAVSYFLLKQLSQGKGMSVWYIYISQYIWITLPILIVGGFGATLLPYVSNGPFWFLIDEETASCRKNLWHNVLHISSSVGYDSRCLAGSWYFQNEMIYFFLAPPLVYLLWRKNNIGLSLVVAWIVQSVVQTGVTIDEKDLMPTFTMSMPGADINAYFDNIVFEPWMRSAPYAVGILMGFFLHCLRASRKSIPCWVVSLGWICAAGVALIVILGPVRYFDAVETNETGDSVGAVLYGSLHRLAWAIAIAWMVFACVNEYGGWITAILSWKMFAPLGRLSMCMHLCAQYIQSVHYMSNYQPVRYNAYNFAKDYVFQMILSILLGYALLVTVQSPAGRLSKLLLHTKN